MHSPSPFHEALSRQPSVGLMLSFFLALWVGPVFADTQTRTPEFTPSHTWAVYIVEAWADDLSVTWQSAGPPPEEDTFPLTIGDPIILYLFGQGFSGGPIMAAVTVWDGMKWGCIFPPPRLPPPPNTQPLRQAVFAILAKPKLDRWSTNLHVTFQSSGALSVRLMMGKEICPPEPY
ncbi:MAG: hypothetical protein HY880_00700 [Deltaproteobacteria bacterium]|nr:hypothetical protein [Deltaproteobacteria bacterium]